MLADWNIYASSWTCHLIWRLCLLQVSLFTSVQFFLKISWSVMSECWQRGRRWVGFALIQRTRQSAISGAQSHDCLRLLQPTSTSARQKVNGRQIPSHIALRKVSPKLFHFPVINSFPGNLQPWFPNFFSANYFPIPYPIIYSNVSKPFSLNFFLYPVFTAVEFLNFFMRNIFFISLPSNLNLCLNYLCFSTAVCDFFSHFFLYPVIYNISVFQHFSENFFLTFPYAIIYSNVFQHFLRNIFFIFFPISLPSNLQQAFAVFCPAKTLSYCCYLQS